MSAAVVAFDNSGTLSETTVVDETLASGYDWLKSVPAAPEKRGTFALVNVGFEELDRFRTDDSLGSVLDDHDVPLRLALSNADFPVDRAREALLASDGVPARTVADQVDRAAATAREQGRVIPESDALPAGAQAVVDVTDGTVVRIVGYTATPIAAAPAVVEWVIENGHVPHIVSGDATGILQSVAEAVGIPSGNVHAYQSADDKRETIESLGDDRPVVMVGDFVNDRFAFEVADVAVFIDDGSEDERVRERMEPLADASIDALSELPTTLQDRVPQLAGDGGEP